MTRAGSTRSRPCRHRRTNRRPCYQPLAPRLGALSRAHEYTRLGHTAIRFTASQSHPSSSRQRSRGAVVHAPSSLGSSSTFSRSRKRSRRVPWIDFIVGLQSKMTCHILPMCGEIACSSKSMRVMHVAEPCANAKVVVVLGSPPQLLPQLLRGAAERLIPPQQLLKVARQ